MKTIKGTPIDMRGKKNIITELSRPMDDQKLYCVYHPTKNGMKMVFASINKVAAINWAMAH